jgi:hypothetical protein
MKKLMLAIVITGVVIAGAIIKSINSIKGADKNILPEQEKVPELTKDFLL